MSTFFPSDGGDLLIQNGNLVLEKDEVIAGAIKLKNRFQFFQGEWFLDTRVGIPYFSLVFIKNPSIEVIKRLFRNVILETPPIVSVEQLDVYYVPGDRLLAFEFSCTASDGVIITGGSGQPFLVDGEPIEGQNQ